MGRDQPVPRHPVRAHAPHRGPAGRGDRRPVRLGPRRGIRRGGRGGRRRRRCRRWRRRRDSAGAGGGEVDELVISTAPVILGAGKRLFGGFDRDVDLEVAKVYSSAYATHVRYTVTKEAPVSTRAHSETSASRAVATHWSARLLPTLRGSRACHERRSFLCSHEGPGPSAVLLRTCPGTPR